MRYTISEAGFNNAALDIYTAINSWLDHLILAGKVSKHDGDLISRGDVGRLNGAVLAAVKSHAYTPAETDPGLGVVPKLQTEYFMSPAIRVQNCLHRVYVRVYAEGYRTSAVDIILAIGLSYSEALSMVTERNQERA